jgi:multiple sugar transport system substrate-binding protein/sn-glycerol 3-phosphate transport system substrate-binding protein
MLLSACTKETEVATPEATQAVTTATEVVTPPEPQPTQAVVAVDEWADVDPTGQVVTFWHQHSGGRERALIEIVDEFNATNEWGITVIAEYQGSYGDIFNKMLTFMNTADVPNLVVAYQNQAATYQLAEALIDMNPLVNSAKWGLSAEEQADFFPGFFAQDIFPNFGNQRLGFPPNRSMEVLFYNMDWLKELGYDAPPTTPAEFKEMACKAVEQPFSGATAEGSIGYELSIDASRFASWAFAFGGDVYDYDAGQYSYNNAGAVAAWTFMQDLFASGCATLVTESYGDQTDFGTGKLLFTVGSSSGLPYYESAVAEGANFAWSVAAIPHTTEDPVMNVYGASVSMPNTDDPARQLATWLFLKYYTSPEVQAKWATVSGYFPVRASVADNMTDYLAANPGFNTAFEMLQYGYFEPPVPGYDFVRTLVGEAMAAIVDGADVQSTLDILTEEANVILEEQLTIMPTATP